MEKFKSSLFCHSYSCVAIMVCLAIGYALNIVVPFLPPSLIGMIVLALLLTAGVINAKNIEASVNWIIRNMGVCFVPAGVGIMEHYELLKVDGPIMLLLTIATTLLLMAIVGWLFQYFLTNSETKSKTKSENSAKQKVVNS